jgi:hypothetical protein
MSVASDDVVEGCRSYVLRALRRRSSARSGRQQVGGWRGRCRRNSPNGIQLRLLFVAEADGPRSTRAADVPSKEAAGGAALRSLPGACSLVAVVVPDDEAKPGVPRSPGFATVTAPERAHATRYEVNSIPVGRVRFEPSQLRVWPKPRCCSTGHLARGKDHRSSLAWGVRRSSADAVGRRGN